MNRQMFLSEDLNLVEKEVILYAMVRSDTPVGKATILSTNPKAKVGGVCLGREFYEVRVDVVYKNDVDLPRPYDDLQTMADAYKKRIAWPCHKMNNVTKRLSGSQTTG